MLSIVPRVYGYCTTRRHVKDSILVALSRDAITCGDTLVITWLIARRPVDVIGDHKVIIHISYASPRHQGCLIHRKHVLSHMPRLSPSADTDPLTPSSDETRAKQTECSLPVPISER
jgi:hypothetical protein